MNSRWAAVLLPFLAGVAIVFAVAGVYLLVRDSGGDDDAVSGSRTPTPTSGPYPVLAEGEYIDSLPSDIRTLDSGLDAVPLTNGASMPGTIALVEITGIVETAVPTPGPGTSTPEERRFQPIPWTTYSARVEQWIKGGAGETEITITEAGGVDYDGPRLLTGTFLAQVGRRYLITLGTPNVPGTGDYQGVLAGWASFEIGDGLIRVLNENNSRRLMGAYNLTPLEDFIAMVREWIIAPPAVTRTPPPSLTASP
jgi:hypothetical protein